MAESKYNNANLVMTSDSFGGLVERVNEISTDLSTVTMTTNPTGPASEENGGYTEGNAKLSGDFVANTGNFTSISGGDGQTPAPLDVNTEIEFNDTATFNSSAVFTSLNTPVSSYISLSDVLVISENEMTIRGKDLNHETGIINLGVSNESRNSNQLTNIGLKAVRNSSEESFFTYRESELAWTTETAIKAQKFIGNVDGSAKRLESSVDINLTGDILGSVSFDGANDVSINTAYAKPIVKYFKVNDDLPNEDIGIIWSDKFNSMMRWMVLTNNGANYRGYASIDICKPQFDVVQTRRDGWIKASGNFLDKRYDYQMLWHFALDAGLVVNYASGKFRFDNVNSNTFRVPDLRGEFLRVLDEGRGADPDSDRNIGMNQGDEFRSHDHDMQTTGRHSHGMSADGNHRHAFGANDGGNNDDTRFPHSSPDGDEFNDYTDYSGNHKHNIYDSGEHKHNIYSRGGAETRPRNFALPMYIKY